MAKKIVTYHCPANKKTQLIACFCYLCWEVGQSNPNEATLLGAIPLGKFDPVSEVSFQGGILITFAYYFPNFFCIAFSQPRKKMRQLLASLLAEFLKVDVGHKKR